MIVKSNVKRKVDKILIVVTPLSNSPNDTRITERYIGCLTNSKGPSVIRLLSGAISEVIWIAVIRIVHRDHKPRPIPDNSKMLLRRLVGITGPVKKR